MKSFNNAYVDTSIIQIILVLIIGIVIGIVIDNIFNTTIWLEFTEICFVIFIVFKIRKSKDSIQMQVQNLSNNFPFKTVIILLILNLLFSIGVAIVLENLTPFIPFLGVSEGTIVDKTNLLFFLGSFLSTVILAPLAEELFFRGVLFSKISSYTTISIGIIISSILFGLLHGVDGFIGALVFGMCMCILFLKTSNILITMTVHFLNNLIASCLELANLDNLTIGINVPDIAVVLIAIIIVIISAYFLFIFIIGEWRSLT
mgnify:FL=1